MSSYLIEHIGDTIIEYNSEMYYRQSLAHILKIFITCDHFNIWGCQKLFADLYAFLL